MGPQNGTLGFARALATLVLCTGCSQSPHDQTLTANKNPPHERLVLGSPLLTAGIEGEGPLKSKEIETWLADPRNHEPLDFLLPLGLADAVDQIRIPEDNPLTRAKIELGRQLFFDKRLSGIGTFSCSTCHQPGQFYTSYQVMPEVGRNASSVINRILASEHFWDGRAASLESQPASPIKNPFEMNSTPQKTTAAVSAIEGYARQFEVIFGEVSFENICRALASFERALVSGSSPWDHERAARELPLDSNEVSAVSENRAEQARGRSSQHAMSAAALRGEALFFSSRAGCGSCHTGPNLTDEQYHNLGAGMHEAVPDKGRMEVTGNPEDLGAFKTPSLRNVAQTPPYMHNGQFRTLEEAVAFIVQGGYPNDHQSPLIEPLHLTQDDQTDLVEFLRSLTSAVPHVETGRLPQ